MSKHANPLIWPTVDAARPAHSKGWIRFAGFEDYMDDTPYTPGRHAKPFAAHHPARPVTYDAQGTVTPLTPAGPILDVVA